MYGEVAKRLTAAVLKTFRHVYRWPLAQACFAHNTCTICAMIVTRRLERAAVVLEGEI
jgi:hypothetical protein